MPRIEGVPESANLFVRVVYATTRRKIGRMIQLEKLVMDYAVAMTSTRRTSAMSCSVRSTATLTTPNWSS